MNEVFLLGKINSNLKFDFIINNKKYISIIRFKIELRNKAIVEVKGYNDIADICYRNLDIGDFIFVSGKFVDDMKIEIKKIEKI